MFPASTGRMWMYALPMDVDGQNGFALLDDDLDVDAKDLAVFLGCMSPPGVPVEPNCLR